MCLNKYEQWVEILWVLIRDISMKIMRDVRGLTDN